MRTTYKTDECTPKLSEELGRCIEGRPRYVDSFIENVFVNQEIVLGKPLKYSVYNLCCMSMTDNIGSC